MSPFPWRAQPAQLDDHEISLSLRLVGMTGPFVGAVLVMVSLGLVLLDVPDAFAWDVDRTEAIPLFCFFVSSTVVSALTVGARSWAQYRLMTTTVFTFVFLLLVGTAPFHDRVRAASLRSVGGIVAGAWFPLLTFCTVLLPLAWLVQARRVRSGQARPVVASPATTVAWVRVVLGALGTVLTSVSVAGVLGWSGFANAWPWRIGGLDLAALGAAAAALSMAAVVTALSRYAARGRPFALVLAATTFGVIGSAFFGPPAPDDAFVPVVAVLFLSTAALVSALLVVVRWGHRG